MTFQAPIMSSLAKDSAGLYSDADRVIEAPYYRTEQMSGKPIILIGALTDGRWQRQAISHIRSHTTDIWIANPYMPVASPVEEYELQQWQMHHFNLVPATFLLWLEQESLDDGHLATYQLWLKNQPCIKAAIIGRSPADFDHPLANQTGCFARQASWVSDLQTACRLAVEAQLSLITTPRG